MKSWGLIDASEFERIGKEGEERHRDYRDRLKPDQREAWDGGRPGRTSAEIAPQNEQLKFLIQSMEAAEAGDDPRWKHLAGSIRMLWTMVHNAEESVVHWMKEADRRSGAYAWPDADKPGDTR
jgi:hypothetical protein